MTAMKLAKCPRCELNYMRPGETLCDVCKRELGKKHSRDDLFEICPSCNEHPVVPGEELCKFCLREKLRLENAELLVDAEDEEKLDVELEDEEDIDSQELADIEIEPLDEEIPEGDLSEIDSEFNMGDEDEEDEEEEDEEEEESDDDPLF